jgi:glutathione synthase/RimK-type ligase-like ATP-grasp enzyme
MPLRPLILSSLSHDIHAHAVSWGLRCSGVEPLWVSSFADPAAGAISLYSDDETPWRASGALGAEIGPVWYRRTRNPEDFPRVRQSDLAFVRTEWARFLKNLYLLAGDLSDRLWINPPAAAIEAENKLVQLRAARRCGVRFPATLVSNDPVEIRAFFRRHGKVIYKPFMTHSWENADGDAFSTYASILDESMLAGDESLRHCPGIYQAYVEKRSDLRVVAIGERLFTVALRSTSGQAFVDWRAHQHGTSLEATVAELPTGCADKLKAVMRALGIVFGCFDLALDDNGEAYFLEVNQAGQFLFLEQLVPQLPLLQAMSAMLGQGRTDYSLDPDPALSYAAYNASDEHAQWWQQVRPQMEAEAAAGDWISRE